MSRRRGQLLQLGVDEKYVVFDDLLLFNKGLCPANRNKIFNKINKIHRLFVKMVISTQKFKKGLLPVSRNGVDEIFCERRVKLQPLNVLSFHQECSWHCQNYQLDIWPPKSIIIFVRCTMRHFNP